MYTLWLLGLVSVTSDRLCMFLFDCCTAGRVNLYLDQIRGVTEGVASKLGVGSGAGVDGGEESEDDEIKIGRFGPPRRPKSALLGGICNERSW